MLAAAPPPPPPPAAMAPPTTTGAATKISVGMLGIAPPGVLMPLPPPAGKSITGPGSTGTPVLPTPVISMFGAFPHPPGGSTGLELTSTVTLPCGPVLVLIMFGLRGNSTSAPCMSLKITSGSTNPGATGPCANSAGGPINSSGMLLSSLPTNS